MTSREDNIEIPKPVYRRTKHMSVPYGKIPKINIKKKKEKTNGWNEKTELNAVRIGELSQSYQQLHIKMSQHYERIDLVYGIINIIISSIVSVGIFLLLNDQFDIFWMIFFNAILSTISTILKAIDKTYGFIKRSNKHKESSIGFNSLYFVITHELGLPRSKRAKANKFMERIFSEFKGVLSGAPNIKQSMINKQKKEWNENKNFDITALREIEIKSETPPSSSNRVVESDKESLDNKKIEFNFSKFFNE